MTVEEVLLELESKSDAKMKAHNTKFGVGDNQYGVKMGDIRSLANKLKKRDDLVPGLWKTGNLEAQLLAVLLFRPKDIPAKQVEDMAKSIGYAQVADWFSSYVLKEYPGKDQFREKWMDSNNKWLARLGWSLLAGKIAKDASGLDLGEILDRIESEMPKAKPELQWTMNFALAYVGIHHPKYRQRAIDIGEKLGIYRNYPVSKGCTSPFAPVWINEMVSRQK